MKCHEQRLLKLLFPTALSVLPPLLTALCLSVGSAAVDPRIQYSTYLSGSKTFCHDARGADCVMYPPTPPTATPIAVAVDSLGNIFVAGLTNETDFPNTKGQTPFVFCNSDLLKCEPEASFLAKFSPQGRLVYSTFLPYGYAAYGMAVDPSGNAYVVGDDNLSFNSHRNFSAFISKFSPTGTLLYTHHPENPLLCGDYADTALAIVLNATGTQAYVAGISPGCIQTTPGAYQSAPVNGIWSIKLDISQAIGASLVYGTYIGPNSGALLGGIAADSQGNAYLTGWTSKQTNWPTTPGAYRTTFQGGTFDSFITKLNSTGSALAYSTYLGGSGDDQAVGIQVDATNDVFVTGATSSPNFPRTSEFGSDSPTLFVTRFNSAGTGLIYSALVHGVSVSASLAEPLSNVMAPIGLDSAGHAYVTGVATSTGFPTANPLQSFLKGSSDAFFTNLNTIGSGLITSSFLGGGKSDAGTAITVDKAWNSYVVGSTTSTDFPVTVNALQPTLKGAQAVFLTKIIIEADLALSAFASPNPVPHGSNLTYTYSVFNKGPDPSDGDTLITTLPSGTTFASFSTTNGTCTHPAVGGTGTFKCTRSTPLLKGHGWGPVTLTVHVNASSGTTLTNTAKVSAKTQDVFQANNSKTVSVKVN
jgi:uncharacterized repeat protein (TIGR01451 family)